MKRPLPPIALAAALAAGCASSPEPSFYTLRAQGEAAQAPGKAQTGTPVVIEIGPVIVPELVDRPQIVVRLGPAQVGRDEFARWADTLRAQIASVLAQNLTRAFPAAMVSIGPVWVAGIPAYRVSIDVQRFESELGGDADIAALWSVYPPGDGQAVNGRAQVREAAAGPGYDAIVEAHSRALAKVSADIARAIRAAQPLPR